MDRRAILSVLAISLVMAVSLAPLAAEASDADMVTEVYPDSDDPKELGFVAGLLIGLAVGGILWAVDKYVVDPETPASDQTEVYKQLRGLYADKLITGWDTAKDMISSVMPADTSLWAFTTNYWNRAVELACAEAWNLDMDYDPDEMAEQAMLRKNIEAYIYDWQAAVDVAYKALADKHTKLTGDCWGDMEISLAWDGGRFVADGSSDFYTDLLQIVTTSGTSSLVYIDTSTEDDGGNYVQKTSGNLYVFGRSATLRYVDTGKTYTLGLGANDVTSMPSGLYRIETSGTTLAGPITGSAFDDSADVTGGMVLVSGSQLAYVRASGDDVVITKSNGSSNTSSYLKYEVSYNGSDGQVTDTSVLCDGGTYNIVRDWAAMVEQIHDVLGRAATAGETIWGIFDSAEASSSFLSPSAITTTVEGVQLTAVQSQAIYVQAMMQIADYWEQHGSDLSSDPAFTTNRESLNLYCYGDIYYNGQLWAENVVFTPYESLGEQELAAGETTVWQGSGFAMIWAQVDDFDAWNGQTSSTAYTLVDLSSGYELVIERIVKDGRDVDSITLQQSEIRKYNFGSSGGGDDPPGAVKVLDAGNLILVIIVELAVILFLLGYAMGQPVVGLIVAIIVAIIGLTCSDMIAALVLGTASWGSLVGL